MAAFCLFSLYYWAFRDLDLVILVAGYGMLGLIAASLLLVALATIRLGWILRREPEPLEIHSDTEAFVSTGYRLPALRFFAMGARPDRLGKTKCSGSQRSVWWVVAGAGGSRAARSLFQSRCAM